MCITGVTTGRRSFIMKITISIFSGSLIKRLRHAAISSPWCLMPNHFHFLVAANELSVEIISDNSFPRQRFSQEVKQLLSSYTKAVNKQMGFTGSIFQQKTKAICVNADHGYSYADTAFHYIHQNPMKAGLVKRMEDYAYSSFQDYIGRRNGKLCNRSLAIKFLDIDERFFYKESYAIIPGEAIKNIIDSKYL